MTRRYTASKLLSALKDPVKLVREAERILSKPLFRRKYGKGINIMEKDWDNLIILDACRADYFSEYNTIDGEFETVISAGSNSREFIDANFREQELHDTIYVTANPFVERISDDVFFRVHYSELFGEWDEDINAIPPDALVEATLQIHKEYPNKRIITHFMQPHVPFIGPTGMELYDRYEFGVFNPKLKQRDGFDIPNHSFPTAVRQGYITQEELEQAYAENVQIGIEHAKELVEQLGGRSVITADHGEALGERFIIMRHYEHGGRRYTPELRVVPWLIVDSDDRRDVIEGEPKTFNRLDDEKRDGHLKALGYK